RRFRERKALRARPLAQRAARVREDRAVVVDEAPALRASESGREKAQVRARAGAEIDDIERRLRAARDRAAHGAGAGCVVRRLAEREPLARKPAHAPTLGERPARAATAEAKRSLASAHVGSAAPRSRARADSAACSASSSSSRASAAARASTSPGGTSKPASPTVSGTAPAFVDT